MCPEEPSGPDLHIAGPDLAGVVGDAEAAGLPNVVIGGFGVIFHGHVRATKDCDLLVPDGEEADQAIMRFLQINRARRLRDGKQLQLQEVTSVEQLRVLGRHGIVDILRGGLPPLDFATVFERAERTELNGQQLRIADLRSIVAFKRLAHRVDPDQSDLRHLEAIHGPLPIEAIPGLDES